MVQHHQRAASQSNGYRADDAGFAHAAARPDALAEDACSVVWQWSLDSLGNWVGYQCDADSMPTPQDANQVRVHNPPSSRGTGLRRAGAANEITDTCLPDREQAGRQARLPKREPTRRQVTDPCDPWIDPNHDAAGSMIAAPAPGNEAARLHLKYDAWNRLVQVRNDPPSRVPPLRRAGANGEPNDLIAIYRYDGLNRRVRKLLPDANGTAYDFYYNEAWQVLEVRKDPASSAGADYAVPGANAAPYKQYVWDIRGTRPPKSPVAGRRRVDAPVLRWCDHNPPSRPTPLRRAGADGDFDPGACEIVYYVNDAQFNTTAIVDPPTRPEPLRRAGANSAKVLERYRYDPYGRVTVLNGDPAVDPDHARDASFTEWTPDPNGTSDWDNEVLYCGYRHDWETGLKHVRRRMLHCSAGRWVQRDPAGSVEGPALTGYVRSRPTVLADPAGLAGRYFTVGEECRFTGEHDVPPGKVRTDKLDVPGGRMFGNVTYVNRRLLVCKGARINNLDNFF